ncbi:hypothetical protein BVC93_29420 [Mycobacterium sp. MS1601]|nr:hypothetical protein BVC93_29420 [Mycobacterium sp. MS1601]
MGVLYLVGALITTGGIFALAARWGDSRQPAAHPVYISVAAGLLWPVVVVGAAQMAVVGLLTRSTRQRQESAEDYALAR